MTVIEAMKLKKRLHRKAEDLTRKIRANASHMSNESPVYGKDQAEKVKGWLQSVADITKLITRLNISVQKTNLQTEVEIQLGGKPVTKTVAEWILRRREMANLEKLAHQALSDGGNRDQRIQNPEDSKKFIDLKVVRYFDPIERDKNVDTFKNEPSMIDAKLEVSNATTELLEDVEVKEEEFV